MASFILTKEFHPLFLFESKGKAREGKKSSGEPSQRSEVDEPVVGCVRIPLVSSKP